MMKQTFNLLLILCLAISSYGQTVVDIIVNSPDHTILEQAVIAAELDDDLSEDGPFTLFAPTDEAFGNLPDGLLDDLLVNPTGTLADVLLYHVVGTEAFSTDLSNGQVITTLQGEDITVTIDASGVMINDNAMVTVADIDASNGVVHVINAVLLPPSLTGTDRVSKANIEVSPNPATEVINVQFPSELQGPKLIEVMNSTGQIISSVLVNDQISSIDVSQVSPGIYFLKVKVGDDSYFDKVVVK